MFVCPPPLACFPSLLLRLSPSISRHITHALQGGSGVCLTLTPMFFFLFCSLSVHLVLNANVAINCVFLCWGTLIMGNTIREMEGLLLPVNSLLANAHLFPSFTLHSSNFSNQPHHSCCFFFLCFSLCVFSLSVLFFVFWLGFMCQIDVTGFNENWGWGLFLVLSFISLVLFTLSREGSLFLSNF